MFYHTVYIYVLCCNFMLSIGQFLCPHTHTIKIVYCVLFFWLLRLLLFFCPYLRMCLCIFYVRASFFELLCAYTVFVHLSGSFVHACLCTMLRFHLFRLCAKMCVHFFIFFIFLSVSFSLCRVSREGFFRHRMIDRVRDRYRQTDRRTEREMDTE